MEIKLLKEVKKNPKIDSFINRPMTIKEIEELEKKYNDGNKFPKAIREYLFLAGNFNNIDFDDYDGIEALQEQAKESLEDTNQTIDRPFFVFDQHDNCSSFLFCYLDEDKDDPDIYSCNSFYTDYGRELITTLPDYPTFVSLVNESVRRAVSGEGW